MTTETPWKSIEDQLLLQGVEKYGTIDWTRISKSSLFGGKKPSDCHERFRILLEPKSWSKQDDDRLIELSSQCPSQWQTIGDSLHREANSCFARFLHLTQDEIPAQIEPTQVTSKPKSILQSYLEKKVKKIKDSKKFTETKVFKKSKKSDGKLTRIQIGESKVDVIVTSKQDFNNKDSRVKGGTSLGLGDTSTIKHGKGCMKRKLELD